MQEEEKYLEEDPFLNDETYNDPPFESKIKKIYEPVILLLIAY